MEREMSGVVVGAQARASSNVGKTCWTGEGFGQDLDKKA
jgi:hypothetical protein